MPYKLELNDIIETKKQHPCGSKKFTITRCGIDFRMLCHICNKEIWIKRTDLEKRIRKIYRENELLDRKEW